jgi:hypothetical protein
MDMFGAEHVNWIAVVVATLVASFWGYIWYSRWLFGNAWREALGRRGTQAAAPWIPAAVSLVCTFISAIALDFPLNYFLILKTPVLSGAGIGVFFGLGFVATTMLSSYLYEGGRRRLFYIDVWYRVTAFGIMGAILGAMR